MESFIVNFFMVMFGIIIGGGVLVWVMNYIIEETQNLMSMEFAEVVSLMCLLLIAALIAMQV